jgi:ABC-type uncharacterized transport system ATPase subunit
VTYVSSGYWDAMGFLLVILILLSRPTGLQQGVEAFLEQIRDEKKLRFTAMLAKIRSKGITVLLVEHDMRAVVGVSDRIICLNHGRIIASAYLGIGEPAQDLFSKGGQS